VVIGIGLGINRCAVTAVVDYLNKRPCYTAVRTFYKRYRVGVYGKVSCNRHIRCHIGNSQRIGCPCVTACPAGEVVIGIGLGINRCAVAAVIDYLNKSPRNTAVRAFYERYRVGVYGKFSRNRYVGRYSCISPRVSC
jgi:actin-like ATPase involved in cell morphogenesis